MGNSFRCEFSLTGYVFTKQRSVMWGIYWNINIAAVVAADSPLLVLFLSSLKMVFRAVIETLRFRAVSPLQRLTFYLFFFSSCHFEHAWFPLLWQSLLPVPVLRYFLLWFLCFIWFYIPHVLIQSSAARWHQRCGETNWPSPFIDCCHCDCNENRRKSLSAY